MEETQNQSQENFQQAPEPQEERVSFPTVGGEKKNNGAKTLLIIGILVLVGILGYVIYKSASDKNSSEDLTQPESYTNMIAPEETPVSSEMPTSTPSSKTDKAEIKVQVQNGTGITGEAAYLQNILKGLGYTNIAVGNSASQDKTETEVSFASSVPSDVVTEITNKLNATYQTVTKVSSTTTTYDVIIITGLKKGATVKPSATPVASPTATPKASPTATP